jgi:hypothetical protein
MANALYDKGRESFLKGEISWNSDNIKVVCVDSQEYTPNLSTDQFLSDIPAGGRIATSGNLTGKTTTAGVADADDPTITGVTGDQFEYLVIYQDTGNAATSRLIAIIDTATGLAFTPSGSDIIVNWSNGASRIFKL